MNALRLRFPNRELADLVLSPGVHAIGRDGEGRPALVGDGQDALAQFCVDRRGVWLQLRDGFRGMHINGRPVRRMAMLRAGDVVYIDGVELSLLSDHPSAAPAPVKDPSRATTQLESDPRVVLRGVGGSHHGRCLSLDRPREVGRAADCDIRIDEPTFAEHHARIEPHPEGAVLRDLGSASGTMVNGYPVSAALLRPGDQVVFDAHHRFVIESPRSGSHGLAPMAGLNMGGRQSGSAGADNPAAKTSRSVGRMPLLLLAAVILAAALSLLLMYGAR